MCNLNEFFETATTLRNKYIEENTPHKDFKIEILSQIVAECFRIGEIPNYLELKYASPINTSLITATAIDLFDLLSIEIVCTSSKDKYCSNFLSTYVNLCLSVDD